MIRKVLGLNNRPAPDRELTGKKSPMPCIALGSIAALAEVLKTQEKGLSR
jgi:hypothetical protein